MTESIRLQRPYSGIGDWLMALNCLKFVNRQRPDVQVFVDFNFARALPAFVPEAFAASDVIYTQGQGGRDTRATTDNLVYRDYPPANYIESMVLHLNKQTGLDIDYERHVFPDFGVTRRSGDYIVMVGQGKRRDRHRKEWGVQNLCSLAANLQAAGHEVRQIGGRWDRPIPGATKFLQGRSFIQSAHELAGARAFIGLENGIMMLAGFLGVPQATIYDGHSKTDRADFDNHLKIAERIEPDAAAGKILAWLKQT